LEILKSSDYPLVIVLGHQEYYPRFGFEEAMKFDIHSPFNVESEVWMLFQLKPGAANEVSGTVVYPEAFDVV